MLLSGKLPAVEQRSDEEEEEDRSEEKMVSHRLVSEAVEAYIGLHSSIV